MSPPLELVCPAGTPSALTAAVEAGADAVYFGFRDRTNARNFPGLNFSAPEAESAITYCRARGVRPMIAINTFASAGDEAFWQGAIDCAARAGAGAVIVADLGLAAYTARTWPELRLHLSVQAAAANPEAVGYYADRFKVHRVVLPRVFTVEDIRVVTEARPDVEVEVFVLGGLCVMAEGRCTLSSYAAARSPNRDGVCSPAEAVRYERDGDVLVSKLNGYTVNRFGAGEEAGYPTLCKGRFRARGRDSYLFEDPVSLDATGLLPDLAAAGVRALKVEGRQRGKAYVSAVVGSLRRAIDGLAEGNPAPPPAPASAAGFAEGGRATEGAYRKGWR
jgi:putative protease